VGWRFDGPLTPTLPGQELKGFTSSAIERLRLEAYRNGIGRCRRQTFPLDRHRNLFGAEAKNEAARSNIDRRTAVKTEQKNQFSF
jgi:hypothetical protein